MYRKPFKLCVVKGDLLGSKWSFPNLAELRLWVERAKKDSPKLFEKSALRVYRLEAGRWVDAGEP